MKLGTHGRAAFLLAASLAAVGAVAQTAPVDREPSAGANTPLNLPANPEFFGQGDPNVRKATAIVNGSVVTGTDVDQRLALLVIANNGQIPAEEMPRLRAQVLRNIVDETLQIQAAEAVDIKVEPREVDAYYAEYAKNLGRNVEEFGKFLTENGASERSIKRQIQGEIAWQRLQSRNIRPFVNVSDEEVRSVIERLEASKGAQEYRIAEIFISATPETAAETQANAARIVQQIRGGASFLAYARQFSEASTAAVGGDLGWVRAEQLPDALAAVARQIPVGQVSDPIQIPGGFSILAVQDTRQVLTADPRDAQLSLKQLAVRFAPNTNRDQAAAKVEELTRISQNMGGCGRAEEAAQQIGAEVVANDQVRVRDLPPPLQEMMLGLNIGQATTPFGSIEEGVRVLVLCGRDDPQTNGAPSFDQVYARLDEERVNRRAQRYLRDLRRDAVVDYR
ncbi:periplasmic chaperone for outer membrane proteins SurA [Allosphingosinicella indica]|uniref:Parvulin-like PPIase n=2 Tax=Allosphingosinicella indica TaxID=941907 RepID=A0A1X7H3X2_9SPHN|nr:periplasmic chaperone for outer membrane proteins SurA [Allosphingosinicella indica]